MARIHPVTYGLAQNEYLAYMLYMPQMHFYVPEPVAKRLRERAHARGMKVSRYLAEMMQREAGVGWPEGFFDKTVGGWKGKPLQREPEGQLEDRDEL
jgi:hypothetical protein